MVILWVQIWQGNICRWVLLGLEGILIIKAVKNMIKKRTNSNWHAEPEILRKKMAADIFYKKWKEAEANQKYTNLKVNWKRQFG